MSGPTLRSVGLECQGAPTSRASRRLSSNACSNRPAFGSVRFERGLRPRNPRGEVRKGIELVLVSRRPRATAQLELRPPSELQELLHDQHIDPFPIEQALLPIDPHLREAHPLVEGHTRLVGGKARENELVEAKLPAEVD